MTFYEGSFVWNCRQMKDFVCNGKDAKLFWQTGLVHDHGKYQAEFQDCLIKGWKRGSAPRVGWEAGFAKSGSR